MTISTEVFYDAARSAPARRSLLQPNPVLFASLAAGHSAPCPTAVLTPIMAAFRDWDALQAQWSEDPGTEGEAYDNATLLLEERIAAEPVTCLADLAAKIVALTSYGDEDLPRTVVAECEALLAEGLA